ncbi:hypothetical protein [Nocardia sp. NPDC003963]
METSGVLGRLHDRYVLQSPRKPNETTLGRYLIDGTVFAGTYELDT